MDISKLSTGDEAAEMPIIYRGEQLEHKGKKMFFSLFSVESGAHKDAIKSVHDSYVGLDSGSYDDAKRRAEIFAQNINDGAIFMDGAWIDCAKEKDKLVNVLFRYKWILKDVTNFVINTDNFLAEPPAN